MDVRNMEKILKGKEINNLDFSLFLNDEEFLRFIRYCKDYEQLNMIVRTKNNKVIAFALFEEDRYKEELYFRVIMVAQIYRRKGIGKKLVQDIEKLGRKKKLKSIKIIPRDDYARHFFGNLGYKPEGFTWRKFL